MLLPSRALYSHYLIEGSLEVKVSTVWTNEKAEGEESEKRREEKRRGEERTNEKNKEDQRKRERVRKHKIKVREKVGKSRNTMSFQCCVAPEGQKVSSLKRRVRCHLVRWEMKKCTPLWCEAHFEVKICKKRLSLGALFEDPMSKKCTPSWREPHSKWTC